MLFLQIILFFVYLIKKIKPIKIFMMIFSDINKINKLDINNKNKNSSPKLDKQPKYSIEINKNSKNSNTNKNRFLKNKKIYKKKEKNNTTKDEDNSQRKINKKNVRYLRNIIHNNKQIKNKSNSNNSKGNIFISNNLAQTININVPILNINKKNFKNHMIKLNLTNKKNLQRKNINKKIISKSVHKMETIPETKNNIIKYRVNKMELTRLLKNDSELQDMEYEEAILYDKRSYLRMYWSFLLESQIILETFCTDNHLYLFVIKLSFFICTFQISFFLNALFYTDDYISDAYHNDGVLDFISGLPKVIYSFIATLITTNLLKMLSNSKRELMRVIKRRNRFNNYLNIINIKMSKLRNKLIIYFIFIFVLGIFFLYYVTAFCAVYRNSQKYWFFGCLESFAMDSLVSVIVCIFLSFLRYIGLLNKIKYCYILANIISIFF